MERHHQDNTEARLVRIETELKNALTDIAEQIGAFDRDHELLIRHGERIDKNQHDIRNIKLGIEECKRHAENIGRAAHDLVAEERRLRREEIASAVKSSTAAIEGISVTLAQNEEKRRKQLDTWFKRVGYAAWTVFLIVLTAYVGTVIV